MKTNKQIQTKEPNQKVYKLFNTIKTMETQNKTNENQRIEITEYKTFFMKVTYNLHENGFEYPTKEYIKKDCPLLNGGLKKRSL